MLSVPQHLLLKMYTYDALCGRYYMRGCVSFPTAHKAIGTNVPAVPHRLQIWFACIRTHVYMLSFIFFLTDSITTPCINQLKTVLFNHVDKLQLHHVLKDFRSSTTV